MAVDGRGADAVAVRGVSQSGCRVAARLLAPVDATSRDRSREQPEVAGAANCGRRRRHGGRPDRRCRIPCYLRGSSRRRSRAPRAVSLCPRGRSLVLPRRRSSAHLRPLSRRADWPSVLEIVHPSGLVDGDCDTSAHRTAEQLECSVEVGKPEAGDLLRLHHDSGQCAFGQGAAVEQEAHASRASRSRPQKSTHTERPAPMSSPHSSRVSRRQASHGDSPSASMTPPGNVQPPL